MTLSFQEALKHKGKPLCKILEKVNPSLRAGQGVNRIKEFFCEGYDSLEESNPFITVDIKGTHPSVDVTKVCIR